MASAFDKKRDEKLQNKVEKDTIEEANRIAIQKAQEEL